MEEHKIDLIKKALEEASKREVNKSRKYNLLLFISILLGVGWFGYTIYSINESNNNLERIKRLEEKNTSLLKDNEVLLENLDSLVKFIEKTSENETLTQDKKVSIIKGAINDSRMLKIQYFPKKGEEEKVYSSLKKLNIPLIEGNPKFPNNPTNAIYYGSNINEEIIKDIIETLYSDGIIIEGYFSFRKDEKKESLIQIVYSRRANESTIDKVENLTGLKIN